MSFIRHRNPDFWLPLQVPVGPVEIDWTHPLARGLIACYVPGSRSFLSDITGIGPTLNLVGASSLAPCSEGIGLASVAAGEMATAVVGYPYTSLTAASLYWRGQSVGSYIGGVNPSPFVALDTTSGASPYGAFAIALFSNYFQLYWNVADTSNSIVNGVSFTEGQTASFAGTFQPGGNAISYVDGSEINSTPFGASPPSFSGSYSIDIGSPSGTTGRSLNAITEIALIYSRVLSPFEVAQLSATPFAMLRPKFVPRRATSSSGPTILYSFGRAAFMSGAYASVAGLGAIAAAARSESLARSNTAATNAATGQALSLSSAHSLPGGITAASGRDSVTTASKALAASAGAIVGIARQTSSATAEAAATVQGHATSAATSTGRGALSTAAFLAGAALAGSVSFARAAASAAAAIVGIDRQTNAATAKAAATTEAHGQATSVSTGLGALSTAAYLVATALASSVSFARATASAAGAIVGIDRQGSAAEAKANATVEAQGQATSVSTGRGVVSAAVFLAATALASSVSFARAGASLTASVVGRATGGSAARAGQAVTTGATALAVGASGARAGLGGIISALGRAFAAAFGRGSVSTGGIPAPQIIVELAPDVRSITLSK